MFKEVAWKEERVKGEEEGGGSWGERKIIKILFLYVSYCLV